MLIFVSMGSAGKLRLLVKAMHMSGQSGKVTANASVTGTP
jgi:hypothetical protein